MFTFYKSTIYIIFKQQGKRATAYHPFVCHAVAYVSRSQARKIASFYTFSATKFYLCTALVFKFSQSSSDFLLPSY